VFLHILHRIQDSGFRIQEKPLTGFKIPDSGFKKDCRQDSRFGIQDSRKTADRIQDSGFRIQKKPLSGFKIPDSGFKKNHRQDSGFGIHDSRRTADRIQKNPLTGFKIPDSGFKKTRQQDSEKNCPPADHRTALPPRRPRPRDCAVRIFCWQFSASCCI